MALTVGRLIKLKEVIMFRERKAFRVGGKVMAIFILMVLFILLIPTEVSAESLPNDAEKIEVEGADAKSRKVLDELEENNGIVMFAQDGNNAGKSRSIQTDNVVLSYSRIIYYENYFTRNFRVHYDGKTRVAYCVQPKEAPPAEGSWLAKEYNSKLMTKALYYSYGYPGYDKRTRAYLSKKDLDDDYDDDDGAYALSHLILSYFYDKQSINSDAFLGVSSETKSLVRNVSELIENTWPEVPDDSSLSLNINKAKAEWDKTSKKQKTPVFKLKGHSDNRIYVTIPQYTTMVRTSDGVTKSFTRDKDNSSKVRVFGGDSFYFTASPTVTGAFKSPEMSGVLTEFQPYLIGVSGKQDILFCGVGEKDSVSFSIDWVDLGQIELEKGSQLPGITADNGNYSLENAKYGVYTGDDKLYGTLTTDKNGNASITVPYGSYYLKETEAPKGYILDDSKHNVSVKSKNATVKVKEKPMVSIPDVLLHKKDKELNADKQKADKNSQFGATLENAQYTVKYYDGYYNEDTDFSKLKPERSWVVKTDSSGKASLTKESIVSGDELYVDDEGKVILPLGTVTIQETAAPRGYLLDSTIHVRQIKGDNGTQDIENFKTFIHEEQIIRGDLKFFKQAEGDDRFLEGIPFRITSKSTGDSAVIVTNKDGIATTENQEIWFGAEGSKEETKGSLPFDTYILEEIRCDKNVGLQLIKGLEIIVDQNNSVVDLGILIDKKISLHTTAQEKGTDNKNIVAGSNTKIRDKVEYKGLEIGKEYIIKGKLMDKTSGKPIVIDGKEVIGESRFTAEAQDGYAYVDFAFNSIDMEGKRIVVFENLYEDGQLIASHEDIDSVEQTVSIAKTGPFSPATGDNLPLIMLAAIAITALFGFMCALQKNR